MPLPALIQQLCLELQAEGWSQKPQAHAGQWRLDAPAAVGSLHLAIHHHAERQWLALYALYPHKLTVVERSIAQGRLASINHALPAGVNFELDSADGDLRCKVGLDNGREQISAESLRHSLYLLAASYLQRADAILMDTPAPQPASGSAQALSRIKPPVLPDIQQLHSLLQQRGWPVSLSADGRVIHTAYAQAGQSVPLLLMLDRPFASIVIKAYPARDMRVAPKHYDSLQRWITRMNYGLPLGYFDLDSKEGLLAFRYAFRLPDAAHLAACLHDGLMVASVAMHRQLSAVQMWQAVQP